MDPDADVDADADATEPSDWDENPRAYYQEVWGFDPVTERVTLEKHLPFYRYEADFPLAQDPALHRAGVTIGARVDFGYFDGTKSLTPRIAFKRGAREALVFCTHLAIYEGPPATVPVGDDLEAMEALLDLVDPVESSEPAEPVGPSEFAGHPESPEPSEPAGPVDLGRSTEHAPVDIPPEEHFVALRSYVAGVAEMGIARVLTLSYRSERVNPLTLPFGFNAEMQAQCLRALQKVAPDETRALVRDHFFQLLDVAPRAWVVERWEHLNTTYGFVTALFRDPAVFDAAVEALGDAAATTLLPDAHAAWCNLGNQHRRAGKHAAAISAFDHALRLDARYAPAWNTKGLCHEDLGDLPAAIAAFRRAITADPRLALAWMNLGIALKRAGHLDQALEACQRAVKLEPDNGTAWLNLAGVHKARGDLLVAIETCIRARDLSAEYDNVPVLAYAHYNLACYHALLGDAPAALRLLRTAIAILPKCREMATTDADFADLRPTAEFRATIAERGLLPP